MPADAAASSASPQKRSSTSPATEGRERRKAVREGTVRRSASGHPEEGVRVRVRDRVVRRREVVEGYGGVGDPCFPDPRPARR